MSYDGRLKSIQKDQKTLLSRWDDNPDDICKFQFRIVTKADINMVPTNLHCDWSGFSIGVHTNNNTRFSKNFVFANDVAGNGVVAIRGQGISGPHVLDLSSPFVWSIGSCNWKITELNSHMYTLRSDCCPYALNWNPNGLDTKWQLYVSDGSKYRDGTMAGMCGDCDGDAHNDWTDCHSDVIKPMTAAALAEISDSCAEGDHDGSFPKGGMKLDGAPPYVP